MGRTMGRGATVARRLLERRRGRRATREATLLARDASRAAGSLAAEAARLRRETEAIRQRLVPLLEEAGIAVAATMAEGGELVAPRLAGARAAVSGVLSAGEGRLAPAVEGAREAVSGTCSAGEAHLAPALEDARERAAASLVRLSERLGQALADAEQLAARASSVADRAAVVAAVAGAGGRAGRAAGAIGGRRGRAESPARRGAGDTTSGTMVATDAQGPGDWPRPEGGRRSRETPPTPDAAEPGPRAQAASLAPAVPLTGAAAGVAAASGRTASPSRAAPPARTGRPGPLAVGFGLGAAQAAFAATFRGPRDRFWQRMTVTGLALGTYAIVARPSLLRRTRIGPLNVLLGAASAATLYETFRAGDRFARHFVPTGSSDIEHIYALRELRPRGEIALRLVTVIAPAEELFWRGMVQEGFAQRYGRWRGAILATAAYGGVHAVTGNFTLMGAAAVAGAHWSALYAAGVPLGALIVSHQLWDVWIFLVQPTGEPAAA